MLKATSRTPLQSSGHPAPSSKPAATPFVLADPQEFLKKMGLTARASNVIAVAPAPKMEPKVTPTGSGLENTPPTTGITSLIVSNPQPISAPTRSTVVATTAVPSKPAPPITAVQLASSTAPPITVTATTSTSQPAFPQIAGGLSANSRVATPLFANRSTGLAASRWGNTQAATTVARPSLNSSSVSSTSTPTQAAPTLLPTTPIPIAMPASAPLFSSSNSLTDSSASVVSPGYDSPALTGTAPIPTAPQPLNTEPDSRLSAGSVPILSGRSVLIENTAKGSRNDGEDRTVKVRVVKNAQLDLILEIEHDGNLILNQPMLGRVSYELSSMRISVTVHSDTYHINFRFPHEASAFEKMLPSHLKKDTGAPTVAAEPIFNVPESVDNLSVFEPDDYQNPSTSLEADTVEAVNNGSISSIQVQTMASDDVLIDLSEEKASVPQSGSALDDLAEMNMSRNPIVEEIVFKLNQAAGGSFLKQISANELSENAVLSAAEKLVLAFLKNSHIFSLIPEDIAIAYMKNTSREILKLAREQLALEDAQAGTNTFGEANVSRQVNNLPVDLHQQSDGHALEVTYPQDGHAQELNGSRQLNDLPADLRQQFNNHTPEVIYPQEDDHPQNDPQQPNDFQQVNPAKGVSIQKSNRSQQPSGYQRVRKYSVTELMTLRDHTSTVNDELFLRTEKLKINGSPRLPRGPSKAATTSKFHNEPYRALFKGVWDPKPAPTQTAAAPPSLQRSKSPQAEPKVDTTAPESQHQKTDPALYGTLLSAIGRNLSPAPGPQLSRSKHCPTPSDVEIRLSQSFSTLNLAPTTQLVPGTVSPQVSQVTKQEAVLKASATAFSPSQPTNKNIILITTNKKEDFENAGLSGLSTSRWSSSANLAPPSFPKFSRLQSLEPVNWSASQIASPPQLAPVFHTLLVNDPSHPGRMQTLTGPEVIDTIPAIAHHMVARQEKTLFPPRPDMFNHRVSNASSTNLDFKPCVLPSSPPDSSRQALSPRKAIQARLDNSLAKRR